MKEDEGEDQCSIRPQPLTAIRILRSLVTLSNREIGADTPEGIDTNRQRARTLLLWPPNLFAFTSEILGSTGAYYLVVSPPRDKTDLDALKEIWPPDLKEIWPSETFGQSTEDGNNQWANQVQKLGEEWRKQLNKELKPSYFARILAPEEEFGPDELSKILDNLVPLRIQRCLDSFIEGFDIEDIKDLLCRDDDNAKRAKHWRYFVLLMTLHAVADETCLGWGIRDYVESLESCKSAAQRFAELQLITRGTLATIHEDRCRILPKRHTPNVGMTLRSISSNLAFYHRSSLEVRWRLSSPDTPTPLIKRLREDNEGRIESLNVLLLPWPFNINATDFAQMKKVPYKGNQGKEAFFQYRPTEAEEKKKRKEFQETLRDVLDSAHKEAGRVDLLILPELSISADMIPDFEHELKRILVSGYIAGVGSHVEDPNVERGKKRFNRNMLYCKLLEERGEGKKRDYVFTENEEDYRQDKHHRWKLNKPQIVKYQLGGVLSPSKYWWEGIKLSRRKVTFVNLGEQITICPMICEDLARQEPISDLIRAVGPTLVVSILMDGPQKMSRWSAGYASVLADDPRSSVLTFTCLGMVNRVQTPWDARSRSVALWKDPLNSPREIELENGAHAIMLYLDVELQNENVADGREEKVATPYLTLGGISYI